MIRTCRGCGQKFDRQKKHNQLGRDICSVRCRGWVERENKRAREKVRAELMAALHYRPAKTPGETHGA